jgi:S-adenosylmethionine:tRNA ribosyltransferase-isomerase
VIPARLIFEWNGKEAELLLVKKLRENVWEVMGRPGKMLRRGMKFIGPPGIQVEVLEVLENGLRIVEFSSETVPGDQLEVRIFEFGRLPLPPYIANFRESTNRYQTIYSQHNGSIAAPTAGLHFTKSLLGRLQDKGIQLEFVTLHVGLGTFLPVKVKDTNEHVMHTESFEMAKDVARRLEVAKKAGRRIVVVGTTAARVLESAYKKNVGFIAQKNSTQIFIQPGYQFQAIDGLITNFHLPQSTLLMLVSALAGREKIARAYDYAIHHQFHFYSFGDAMLIL